MPRLPLSEPADAVDSDRYLYGFHPDTRGGVFTAGAFQRHAEDHATAVEWLIEAVDDAAGQDVDACATPQRADELEGIWHAFMEEIENAAQGGKDVRLAGPNGWIFYVEEISR